MEGEGGGAQALDVRAVALAAKRAARALAIATTAKKNAALLGMARLFRAEAAALVEANAADLAAARETGLSSAMIDRLRLDEGRVESMARAVEDIARLPDPVGRIEGLEPRPNGLMVGKMLVPIGLIGIVYESRPNVTADAAALCLKSGNGCLLRGGKEAIHSNRAIAALIGRALAAEGLPKEGITLLAATDREAIRTMARLDGVLDLLIPRGGEALIRFVTENATVPVIQHYKGVCHVYVDGDADLEMAERIAVDAKVRRPSACNSLETLLVDAACAERFLPAVGAALRAHGVELRCDAAALALLPDAKAATDADWDAEYLDLVIAIRVVEGIDGALAHVAAHGSLHTEAIVTRSYERAQRWIREVDASLVLVNASTRFNDGGELGLGAEMGISTTKLHAYGPMGLAELCAKKWVAYGDGQIRG